MERSLWGEWQSSPEIEGDRLCQGRLTHNYQDGVLTRVHKSVYWSEKYQHVLLSARRWCTSTQGSISRSSCLMRIQTKMISWEGKFFFITSEEARSLRTSALWLRCESGLCCNLPAIRRRDKTCGTACRVLIKVWKQGVLLKGIIKHKEGEVLSTVLSPRAETIDFFSQGCNTSHSFDYIHQRSIPGSPPF